MAEINAIITEHGNDSDSALATKLFTTIQQYVTTNPSNIGEIDEEVYLKLRKFLVLREKEIRVVALRSIRYLITASIV